MGLLKNTARTLAKTLINRDLEGLGFGSYALINRNEADKAWFSYSAQLNAVLKRFDVDLVIDVGANEGQFAQSIRPFYHGNILSFEPVSSVFKRLSQTAASDPKWHLQNMALGSENAQMTIHVSDHSVFSSLLTTTEYCAEHFGATSVGTREETVSVRRLGEVLDEIAGTVKGQRIFLKLDTQGYDIKVFEGLGDKLKNVVAMQSEVSLISIYEGMPHWTEGVNLYERAGFGVVGMFPVNRDAGRVIEFDCLLQRAA